MSDLIAINNTQIERLTYKDEPVVTFEMIAKVHGIPVRNVHRTFERHQERFAEGTHVYRLDYAEARQLPLTVEVSPNGLRLFTQKGYLLLVKPMKDDTSWQVQERMIDDYFAMRQALQSPSAPLPLPRTAEQDLNLVEQSLSLLERLHLLDNRDRLFYADHVRNITRRGLTPATGADSQRLLPLPSPPGASISDRLYVIAPRLSTKDHRRLTITGGKLCAAEYRLRYPGRPIEQFQQYIDGAMRPVNWFLPHDWEWIDTILQARVAALEP